MATATKKAKAAPKKDLAYYMGLPYTYSVTPSEVDGKPTYYVRVSELKGCGTSGKTLEEAMTLIREAMEGWLEVALEEEMPIPEPGDEDQFSGKFQVRVPKTVHAALARKADQEGVSLNLFVASELARAVGEKA